MGAREKDVSKDIKTAVELEQQLHMSHVLKGVFVLDVYSSEWGPCKALAETFRRLHTEAGDGVTLRFFTVECNAILESLKAPNQDTRHRAKNTDATKDTLPEVWQPVLEAQVGKSRPLLLFYKEGKLVERVEGVNTPAIKAAVQDLTTVKTPAADYVTSQRLLEFWEEHFNPEESEVTGEKFLKALANLMQLTVSLSEEEKGILFEAVFVAKESKERTVTAEGLQKWFGDDEGRTVAQAFHETLPDYAARAEKVSADRAEEEERRAKAAAEAEAEERRQREEAAAAARDRAQALADEASALARRAGVRGMDLQAFGAARSGATQRARAAASAALADAAPPPAGGPEEEAAVEAAAALRAEVGEAASVVRFVTTGGQSGEVARLFATVESIADAQQGGAADTPLGGCAAIASAPAVAVLSAILFTCEADESADLGAGTTAWRELHADAATKAAPLLAQAQLCAIDAPESTLLFLPPGAQPEGADVAVLPPLSRVLIYDSPEAAEAAPEGCLPLTGCSSFLPLGVLSRAVGDEHVAALPWFSKIAFADGTASFEALVAAEEYEAVRAAGVAGAQGDAETLDIIGQWAARAAERDEATAESTALGNAAPAESGADSPARDANSAEDKPPSRTGSQRSAGGRSTGSGAASPEGAAADEGAQQDSGRGSAPGSRGSAPRSDGSAKDADAAAAKDDDGPKDVEKAQDDEAAGDRPPSATGSQRSAGSKSGSGAAASPEAGDEAKPESGRGSASGSRGSARQSDKGEEEPKDEEPKSEEPKEEEPKDEATEEAPQGDDTPREDDAPKGEEGGDNLLPSAGVDWAALAAKLPMAKTDEDKAARAEMFGRFDPNGNGYLSLAEVDKGIRDVLECDGMFDCKPVIMRAFQASKAVSDRKNMSSRGADYVERNEFRMLLVYLRQYFELWQMFTTMDKSDDRRVSAKEFMASAELLGQWGVEVKEEDFAEIDKNGGGMVLFDEFAAWALDKSLDLVEDDENEAPPKADEELEY